MNSDNSGRQSKSDVPPHKWTIKLHNPGEVSNHGRFNDQNEGTYRE